MLLLKRKEVIFKYKDYNIKIIDLPGSYSLENYSFKEKVVKNFLNQNEYDIILNVIDSTNLQRNLLLTSELLALNKKMVIALNMSDEAKKENILINNEKTIISFKYTLYKNKCYEKRWNYRASRTNYKNFQRR